MIWRFAPLALLTLGLAACETPGPDPGNYVAREIPTEQSRCELAANEYAQQHPDWLKADLRDHPDFPPDPFWTNSPLRPTPPYTDALSGITFTVEADGRHVTATDKNGVRLWVRDPFVDSNMCPYRTAHPFVVEIGPLYERGRAVAPAKDAAANASIVRDLTARLARYGCHPGVACNNPQPGDRFVILTFNSSQYGEVNIRTGDFYYSGQN